MSSIILRILCYFSIVFISHTLQSGFWYGNTRPPDVKYDSLPYANLTVRINRAYQDGPGDNLVSDPFNSGTLLYQGETINRQTFDTQFVLDLQYSIGIEPERVYVLHVTQGDVHFTWESTNVIVSFIFLERNSTQSMTLLEAIETLTKSIQNTKSKLYIGTNVTVDIDAFYGLSVQSWDISLKLTYAIQVIGGNAVKEGYYLNQGSLGICSNIDALNSTLAANFSTYCEFERFFEDDVSRALNISYYRVQVLFIKTAALDAVLVHFRIQPPMTSNEDSVEVAVANLIQQVGERNSTLYFGNVTLRTDPTWGVSQTFTSPRPAGSLFTLRYYEYDQERLNDPIRSSLIQPYDRCKANRRCNWGLVEHDQYTNDVRFFQRLFERGTLFETNLFLDFEDWRIGSRGFSWNGYIPPTKSGYTSIPKARAADGIIRGAHFWPFDQASLGPDIPCYLTERNQGLVLDRKLQNKQINQQEALIKDIKGRTEWIEENIEVAQMNAVLRSRKDVRANLTWVKADYHHWYMNEVAELVELNTSQCVSTRCMIQFNTSSLELTGAITGTGVVKYTSSGTEVALFSFNSIYLGPEVEVILVGQRALSLVSKTSIVINTTILVKPGTIGGFQGGGSVARYESDQLSDNPRSIFICSLGNYCNFGSANSSSDSSLSNEAIISNNVNGPGSGNLRINTFVIKTSAAFIQEVQSITTTAQDGQTLAGGFVLSYKNYSTPIIPHDATSMQLKYYIENNLNLVSPSQTLYYPNRLSNQLAGVGIVNVTRSRSDGQEGYTWNITFTTAIGNIPQMNVTSFLFGIKAKVAIRTIIEGNEIGGFFTLDFQGYRSQPISAKESATGLQLILEQLPPVTTAYVTRNDPTENCDDGLCPYGPFPCHGLLWTVYITTDLRYDDVTPTSPTSPIALTEGYHYQVTANFDSLTGYNASVSISLGASSSLESPMNLLNVTFPFSLAWGGAGGSYGGLGGRGYGINPVGSVYNDEKISDLIGGSGGCMKAVHPYEINSFLGPTTGLAGHGGGAIEIIAANDLTIGTYGKIIANGGDGDQTSQGGAGGGSGGAILLTSGSTIIVDGLLDVSGGNGGYGNDQNGGGGSGGRIAIFADSITVNGDIVRAGGKCGVYTFFTPVDVLVLNSSLYMITDSPLNDDRIAYLGSQLIELTGLDTLSTNTIIIQTQKVNSTIHILLNLSIIIDQNQESKFSNLSVAIDLIQSKFDKLINTNIAEIVLLSCDIYSYDSDTISPMTLTSPTSCTNDGSDGTYYTEAKMTTSMYIRETSAAENTTRAIFLSNRETTNTTSGSPREAPFSWNGPIVPFEASKPTRITYYTKTDSITENSESKKQDYGSLFSLISRGESGLNISSVIGVYFGNIISHGANFGSAVDEKIFLKRMVTIGNYPRLDRWYKIDIFIQWENHTYSISIDDQNVAVKQSFSGSDVDGIRLSVYRAVDVWFDEIYVGLDNTMSFTCPSTTRTGTSTEAPVQRHWSFEEVHGGNSNGYTEYYEMTRHYNFLSTEGSIAFDGLGAVKDFQDIKLQYSDGDYPLTQGNVHAGALVYLTNSARSAKTPLSASYSLVSPNGLWSSAKDGIGGAGDGRQFWYTEYDYNSTLSSTMNGGVAACSSQDLTYWRFEGIVFHYTNISDMIYNSDGPFYLERPKVLFNSQTSSYVMVAVMDHGPRDLALSAILTSPFVDGPFLFRRSFYPDGNETRDQVIFVNDANVPLLTRTYYQTVEFVIPEAIMQPSWETAKSSTGVINYRSSYQRAFYDIGYDNFNDIFNQRWRKEDIAYEVSCVNKITGVSRNVPSGTYNTKGLICDDPEEYKVVIGQGNPIVKTVFVSPNESANSWWRPTSVPAVEAQPWSNNYRDGFCGIRKLNDDYDINDPNLANFVPVARNTCSNIADNPVHPTLQDKLIGVLHVLTTRRAKFIAVSQLTDDYLDTNGYLSSYEGELESGDLISMINELGQFGFGAGEKIKSTFNPPVRSEFDTAVDYKTRFHQYIKNHNDRATYSLACVIDGTCPVNFRDELTTGQF
eukprot:gene12059-16136_t